MPADFASENREHWLHLWPRSARPSGGGCDGKPLTLLLSFLAFQRGREQQGRGYVDANNGHASLRRKCRQAEDGLIENFQFLDLAP